jgi:four helix bundle protein
MNHVRDLKVWQKAHEATLKIYKATMRFPSEEKFGLVSQLRRAAISVEANLSEGSKKKSRIDFARFVNIAEGSAGEIEALLLISADLGFLTEDEKSMLCEENTEIQKMLFAFRTKLETSE